VCKIWSYLLPNEQVLKWVKGGKTNCSVITVKYARHNVGNLLKNVA